MPGPEQIAVNFALALVDADCHRQCKPLLSSVIVHEDGTPCSTFIRNIDLYGLRRPGETDVEARERIAEECYVSFSKPERPPQSRTRQ